LNDTTFGLIDKIYASVTDPSPAHWQSFLEHFLRAVGATHGALNLLPPESADCASACWAGWTDSEVTTYLSKYAVSDPWGLYAARLPEGSVRADFEYCPRDVAEASAAFREFYAPAGCIHGMGGVILVSNAGLTAVTASRGQAAGPFGETEKALLNTLMPHLRRSVLIYGEFLSLRRQSAMFTDHLDRYPHALFLTDGDASIMYANSAARELTARKDGIKAEGRRLILQSRDHDRRFRETIREMAAGRGPRLARLTVPTCSDSQPYRMIAIPALGAAIPLAGNMPALTLMVVDPGMRLEPDLDALCELFSLTPAEARVASRLAIGWSINEIASDSGLSPETVRTHVKRLLSKTGTVRQGELISLVWRSMPAGRP
jgi:DNA-binding CsgD family transcriptional regulator